MSAHGDIPELRCPACRGGNIAAPIVGTVKLHNDGSWDLRSFTLDRTDDAICDDCGHEGSAPMFIKTLQTASAI